MEPGEVDLGERQAPAAERTGLREGNPPRAAGAGPRARFADQVGQRQRPVGEGVARGERCQRQPVAVDRAGARVGRGQRAGDAAVGGDGGGEVAVDRCLWQAGGERRKVELPDVDRRGRQQRIGERRHLRVAPCGRLAGACFESEVEDIESAADARPRGEPFPAFGSDEFDRAARRERCDRVHAQEAAEAPGRHSHRGVVDLMRRRAAAVPERHAAQLAARIAVDEHELAHRDVFDRHFERQHQRRGQRRRSARRGQRDGDPPRAQAADRHRARPQGSRRPFQRHVLGDQAEGSGAVGERTCLQRRQQRAPRSLELQGAAAAHADLAGDELERGGAAQPRERRHRRQRRQRQHDHQHAGVDQQRPAPSPTACGWGLGRARHAVHRAFRTTARPTCAAARRASLGHRQGRRAAGRSDS